MSTPKTDEMAQKWDAGLLMPSDLLTAARELERELQVANNWVEHHQNHCDDLIKENAALRHELEEVKRVRYCVENALTRSQAEAAALSAQNAELRAALEEIRDLKHLPIETVRSIATSTLEGWRNET